MHWLCYFSIYSLQMIIRQGRFVEYSVFGKETSVDWTIISDAKGMCLYTNIVTKYSGKHLVAIDLAT